MTTCCYDDVCFVDHQVLWEIITREIPFHGISGYQLMWLVVEEGRRLTIPQTCPKPFSNLMKSCWETDYRARPSFKSIMSSLDAMLDDEELKLSTERFLSKKMEWGYVDVYGCLPLIQSSISQSIHL